MPGCLAALAGLAALSSCGISSYGQDAPLDASEISRDLLYLAPSHAERRLDGDVTRMAYVGTRYEYERQSEKNWSVLPAKAGKPETSREKQRVTEFEGFELVGASDDDRATLALRKKGSQDSLATVTLWDRDRLVDAWLPEMRKQKRGLTADGLRQDLEVADPQVRAIDQLVFVNKGAGGPIVVAVGQSTGESELGLATIVKFEPDTRAVAVYHPAGMLTCEVSAIRIRVNAQKNAADVWFGATALRDGVITPCGGLFKLDTETRAVSPAPGGKNPPIGSVVTLLAAGWQGPLDVATDEGVCELAYRSEDSWTCWRFVPTVTLKDAVPVANRPGDKPYGRLKAGDYEVLWANQNYLEVATPDSFDAWLAADDYAEAAARNFDIEPYKLLNTTSGGPGPIRPVGKPGAEPLSGALVYRAPLEKLATPAGTAAGWVKVRARVGWIERKNLDVQATLVESK